MTDLAEARALTLVNPWAYAITNCGKRIENRSWAPRKVTEILIHAGARTDLAEARDSFTAAGCVLPPSPTTSAIVAVATLVGVCTKARIYFAEPTCDCGVWAARGQMHWQFDNVRVLDKPVPCRGRQQLWIPAPEVLEAVKEQI